ncbi:MAG: GPGG-motif small membrane protein [Acidimicrobiales bacterium]
MSLASLLTAAIHGFAAPLLWIIGLVLIVAGVISLVRRGILLGVILIVIGIVIGGLHLL